MFFDIFSKNIFYPNSWVRKNSVMFHPLQGDLPSWDIFFASTQRNISINENNETTT